MLEVRFGYNAENPPGSKGIAHATVSRKYKEQCAFKGAKWKSGEMMVRGSSLKLTGTTVKQREQAIISIPIVTFCINSIKQFAAWPSRIIHGCQGYVQKLELLNPRIARASL